MRIKELQPFEVHVTRGNDDGGIFAAQNQKAVGIMQLIVRKIEHSLRLDLFTRRKSPPAKRSGYLWEGRLGKRFSEQKQGASTA